MAIKNQDTLASVLGEKSGRAQPSDAGADDNDVVNSRNVALIIRDSDVHRSFLQRISVRRPFGQLDFLHPGISGPHAPMEKMFTPLVQTVLMSPMGRSDLLLLTAVELLGVVGSTTPRSCRLRPGQLRQGRGSRRHRRDATAACPGVVGGLHCTPRPPFQLSNTMRSAWSCHTEAFSRTSRGMARGCPPRTHRTTLPIVCPALTRVDFPNRQRSIFKASPRECRA